jgi:TonB family protein
VTARVAHAQCLSLDRLPLTTALSYSSHTAGRWLIFAIALALHAALIPLFSVNRTASVALPIMNTWIVGVEPTSSRKADSDALMPAITVARVLIDPNEVISALPPPIIRIAAEPNGAAVSVAPQWDDSSAVDVRPYAQAAGLLPGEGATVVLRIEVLPDGDIGQVVVDTSGGSAQVDAQAVQFARAQRWISGAEQGVSKSMWMRWAVRLEVPTELAAHVSGRLTRDTRE